LRSTKALAAALGGVGSLHFVMPRSFESSLPRWIPAKRAVIYASGVVEVGCAVGLIKKAPWAPPAALATLAAIWPANIQMALDAGTGRNEGAMDSKALMWARVPLQLPMMWMAWKARSDLDLPLLTRM
jgi:uncharacterized membrane protein